MRNNIHRVGFFRFLIHLAAKNNGSHLVKTDFKRAVDDGCSIEKSKIRFDKAFSKFKTRNISLSGLTAKTTSSDVEKYWKENYKIRWSSSGSSIIPRWSYSRVQTKMGWFRKRTGKRFGQNAKRWRKTLRKHSRMINEISQVDFTWN